MSFDPERNLDKVGAHCYLQSCRSLDFLPNVCEGCNKSFCLEHAKFADHSCPTPVVKIGGTTVICNLCDSILPVPAGSYENDVLSAHTKKGCPKKSAIAQHKCSFCPTMEAIKIVCPNCKNNYCLKHRLERNHNCKKRENPPLAQTIPPHLQTLLNQLRNSKPGVKTNS